MSCVRILPQSEKHGRPNGARERGSEERPSFYEGFYACAVSHVSRKSKRKNQARGTATYRHDAWNEYRIAADCMTNVHVSVYRYSGATERVHTHAIGGRKTFAAT